MADYPILNLNQQNFEPFGTILEHNFPNPTGRDFAVVAQANSVGWKTGILEIVRDNFPFLERHLDSKETHEPLSGTSIIIVENPETADDYSVFLLDKPVCVNEAVWHQVIAISDKSVIKVVENIDVSADNSEIREFPAGVKLKVAL